MTTKDHPLCWTMSYPQGTTLDNFHLTTIHKNMSLSSLDESWLLTNLLYHVLEVNNHFHSTIKINLLQLKNTHISDILSKARIFLGTPPCTDVTASFWGVRVKNSHLSEQTPIVFSTYHGKFSYLSRYLYTWWNTTDLSAITDISVSCLWLKLKLKQDSMVLFTPGSLLTWGKSPSASPGVSSRYLPAIYL